MLKGDITKLKELLENNENGSTKLNKDILLQASKKLDALICTYQDHTK